MKILHLKLKKKWFGMILSGEKKEEYREIKPYWVQRLVDIDGPEEEKGENKLNCYNIEYDINENGYCPEDVLRAYYAKYRHFDAIRFTNGYSKNAPSFLIECKSVTIDFGETLWGADPFERYFVITLGKLIPEAL